MVSLARLNSIHGSKKSGLLRAPIDHQRLLNGPNKSTLRKSALRPVNRLYGYEAPKMFESYKIQFVSSSSSSVHSPPSLQLALFRVLGRLGHGLPSDAAVKMPAHAHGRGRPDPKRKAPSPSNPLHPPPRRLSSQSPTLFRLLAFPAFPTVLS
ncbi:hypothetical protein C8R44DRAFT_867711 [Mycena epipterygia]|nr:hypothetical protein C8R44DRAFT_867711 [Mycena epipterygia]